MIDGDDYPVSVWKYWAIAGTLSLGGLLCMLL